MNLPDYIRAQERAIAAFDLSVSAAKDELTKTLHVIREEFFEDRDTAEAKPRYEREDRP